MSFLRRLLDRKGPDSAGAEGRAATDDQAAPAQDLDAAEREHELEVVRAEQDRLSELQQRQLRYADHAWEPPAQGGERRADDESEPSGS
jgi:hypothetical protein